jgi:hypothetical protein
MWTLIFLGNETFVPVHDVTLKKVQTFLKTALSQTSKTDFGSKWEFLKMLKFKPTNSTEKTLY